METEQRSMQPLVHIMTITIETAGGLSPPERRSEAKVRSEGRAPFARLERSTFLSANCHEPRASTWLALLLTCHFTSCDFDWIAWAYNASKCALASSRHSVMWYINAPYINRHSDLFLMLCLIDMFKHPKPSLVRTTYITL